MVAIDSKFQTIEVPKIALPRWVALIGGLEVPVACRLKDCSPEGMVQYNSVAKQELATT